jgi:hypothetical protein
MALLTAPPAALVVLAVAAALLALLPRGSAQISAPPAGAPAPSSSLDCAGALLNLTPCLTYVERRSALTRPEKGCCGALAAVVGGDDAACLCALLAGNGARGVRVDTVRALALPTICRVDAPPPRLCAALGMPVAEPPGGAAADAPMDSGTYLHYTARSGLPVFDKLAFCNDVGCLPLLVGISDRLINNFESVVGTLGNHLVNSA